MAATADPGIAEMASPGPVACDAIGKNEEVSEDGLGSPVVPFTPFFLWFWFPYTVTNPQKGALIVRYYKMVTGLPSGASVSSQIPSSHVFF